MRHFERAVWRRDLEEGKKKLNDVVRRGGRQRKKRGDAAIEMIGL